MTGGPTFVRVNPDTPCQPNGAHHPHRWKCIDPDCDGWGIPCDYAPLICCVCKQEWPCEERQRRDAEKTMERRTRHSAQPHRPSLDNPSTS